MSSNQHKKISMGYVVQVYGDLKCVEQRFVSANDVEYTSMSDVPLPVDTIADLHEHEIYQPFDMVQPQHVEFRLGPIEKEMFQKHLLFYLTQYPEELIDQLCQVVMDYPEFLECQEKSDDQKDIVKPVVKKKISHAKHRRLEFIAVLRDHLKHEPTDTEIEDMMETYMDYLEDFQDESDIPDIRAAYLREG